MGEPVLECIIFSHEQNAQCSKLLIAKCTWIKLDFCISTVANIMIWTCLSAYVCRICMSSDEAKSHDDRHDFFQGKNPECGLLTLGCCTGCVAHDVDKLC
jgi:hypothetical protein